MQTGTLIDGVERSRYLARETGVAGKLFETLAKEGVNIKMISTSEIKISVVIDLAKGGLAMKAVHAAFIG